MDALSAIWAANELPVSALDRLHLSDAPDPSINSSFKLGTVAQTTIALSALSAARFHTLQTGIEQDVSVDARHAVLEFRSEAWYTINNTPADLTNFWDVFSDFYKTKDNRYVRIHTNFPHHRQGILDILRCKPTKEALAQALLQWNAIDFENHAASKQMCASVLRSFDEWDKHPQAEALRGVPPVQIIKVGDAPPRSINKSSKFPLDGIRVLDLTRVLAGPTCGRALAAHGADVLFVTSPNLPALPLLDVDTSRGKRTTQLDLTNSSDHSLLASLVKDADVFLQAYRPDGLAEKGFGVGDVVHARPGIVYASLRAYGWEGPWMDDHGFDSLVQTATGLNFAEGESYATFTGADPMQKVFPMQSLDHAAGYFLAFGINAALCKTITEGGSYEVRVSLAATAQWLRSLGQLDPHTAWEQGRPFPARTFPQDREIERLAVKFKINERAGGGEMTAIRHAAVFSKTPVVEQDAPLTLNAHEPVWLPRV